MKYFSKSTKGFYASEIHGARTMMVPDSNWKPSADHPDAPAPLIEVPNPDCMLPADAVEISEEEHAALMQQQANGMLIAADVQGSPVAVTPPPLNAEERAASGERAIQKMLDEGAQAKNYDNILTAVSYAGLPTGTPFQAEGKAYGVWRAKCWAKAIEIRNAVIAGTRSEPTIEELLAEMPSLVLP